MLRSSYDFGKSQQALEEPADRGGFVLTGTTVSVTLKAVTETRHSNMEIGDNNRLL